MSANSLWPGVVANKSSTPVWVIWDEGDSEATKKWIAKPLAAGRRSPKGLDIDGVGAYGDGMKIIRLDWKLSAKESTPDWWWLVRGAEVAIKDRTGNQTIQLTSQIGTLKIVANTEVESWGVDWQNLDLSWGRSL